MDFEIIDFHTHPFFEDRQNICPHREYCGMSAEGTRRTMEGLGISKICGSVIRDFRSGIPTTWQARRRAAPARHVRRFLHTRVSRASGLCCGIMRGD